MINNPLPPPSRSICSTPCKPHLSALTGHAPRGHPKHGVYGRPGKVRGERKGRDLISVVSCHSSASWPILEAFLNIHLDKVDAGVEEKPPQYVAESAEPEQVTTGLQQKLARGPLRGSKRGFYRRVATVVGTRSLIAFIRGWPNQIKKQNSNK